MDKLKIAVLFGGASSEYEVSLMSAASVIRNISPERFDVVQIGITKEGRWYQYFGSPDSIEDGSWLHQKEYLIPAFISPSRQHHGIMRGTFDDAYSSEHIDVIFPVLHGKNGEDGTIQGLFEMAGIPYVGCPVLASAICMDKSLTNTMLDHHGIRRAPWHVLHKSDMDDFDAQCGKWEQLLGYPMFVKPANAGSSVGITKVRDREQLKPALELAFEHDSKALIEKTITGREFECSVLGNLDPIVSQPGEIQPFGEFYDYDEKYNSDKINTIVVANLSEDKRELIRSMAANAFKILNCRGLARVDFLMDDETGTIYLNEVNTMPGFTSISMYPKMLIEYGIPYDELVTRLIDLALERSRLGI